MRRLMANSGSVYAFDISAKRLERLKPRLRRAGLDNVRSVAIQNERDDRVQRLAGKIDRVLVDAPCSGTGTLRRNPDIKWRAIDVAKLVATQRVILASASTLLKPGGRLVYATCSLLREENDAVVADFSCHAPGVHTLVGGGNPWHGGMSHCRWLARICEWCAAAAATPARHRRLLRHGHGTAQLIRPRSRQAASSTSTRSSASTIPGSNWVPAPALSLSRACAGGTAACPGRH